MTLDEALGEIALTVRDEGGKLGESLKLVPEEPDAFTTALKRGLAMYSQISPRRVTAEVACGADGLILFSAVAGFNESFVNLMSVEYPIVRSGRPNWLDGDSWMLDQNSSGAGVIRFTWTIPPLGSMVRIAHFVAHELPSTDEFTLPATDMMAVIHFGASAAFVMLAGEYAQSSESVIASAPIAGFINKSAIYSGLARDERKRALAFLKAGRLHAVGEVRLERG